MAKQYVTGPCDIFVNFGTTDGGIVTAPKFLGHSDRGPRIQIRPQFTNTFVDIMGLKTPFDAIYDGEDALVSFHLNRWNPSIYHATSHPVDGNSTRGESRFGDVGTLMVYEGAARFLWIRFPHRAKPAYSEQVAGYRFHAAFLQTDDLTDLGSKPRKISLVFHCLRKGDFSDADQTALGSGRFTLFDHDMDGLPPVD